jgi:succinate dehydrogenase / fumarate reductase flavoprotein subunit
MILVTLFQNCVKQQVTFFDEYFVVDLIIHDNICRGVIAIHIDSGEMHLPLEGGCWPRAALGRVLGHCNAHSLTGDPVAAAFRRPAAGRHGVLPVPPTGLPHGHPAAGYGAREGGVFINGQGSASWSAMPPP